VRHAVKHEHLLFEVSVHHQLVLLLGKVNALALSGLGRLGFEADHYLHLLFVVQSAVRRPHPVFDIIINLGNNAVISFSPTKRQ
jgi:hypothetical protein